MVGFDHAARSTESARITSIDAMSISASSGCASISAFALPSASALVVSVWYYGASDEYG